MSSEEDERAAMGDGLRLLHALRRSTPTHVCTSAGSPWPSWPGALPTATPGKCHINQVIQQALPEEVGGIVGAAAEGEGSGGICIHLVVLFQS